jgi:hypothetical protein
MDRESFEGCRQGSMPVNGRNQISGGCLSWMQRHLKRETVGAVPQGGYPWKVRQMLLHSEGERMAIPSYDHRDWQDECVGTVDGALVEQRDR